MFLPKLAVRSLPTLHLAIYANAAFFLGTLLVMAFQGFHLAFDLRGALFAMLAGIFGAVGQIFFIHALQHGPMTAGGLLATLYPMVAIVLAFFILGEQLTLLQTAGIVLGICSMILMVIAHDRSVKK